MHTLEPKRSAVHETPGFKIWQGCSKPSNSQSVLELFGWGSLDFTWTSHVCCRTLQEPSPSEFCRKQTALISRPGNTAGLVCLRQPISPSSVGKGPYILHRRTKATNTISLSSTCLLKAGRATLLFCMSERCVNRMSYQKKYRSKSTAGTKACTYSNWPPKANAEASNRRMLAPAPGLSRIGGGEAAEELEQRAFRGPDCLHCFQLLCDLADVCDGMRGAFPSAALAF